LVDREATGVVRGTHGGLIVPGDVGWAADRGERDFGVDRVVRAEVGEAGFVGACLSRGI
jgi:hypothetical protein